MDDRTDEMMVEWFRLVRKRNELVREETTLIYASVVCIVSSVLNLNIHDAIIIVQYADLCASTDFAYKFVIIELFAECFPNCP